MRQRREQETMVPLPSSIDFEGIRRNSKEPGRIGRAYKTSERTAPQSETRDGRGGSNRVVVGEASRVAVPLWCSFSR